MVMRNCISIVLLFWSFFVYSQQRFSNLQEILTLAEKNSYTSLIAAQQQKLAELTTKSAYGNAFNPRIPTAASITDNAKLPVSFIPTDAFGGPSGNFRQVTLGQRYVTVMNISPQFDLLNFGSLAKIKSAKLNEKLTNHTNLLTKKNLFDQLNACYHNILSFQTQIAILQQNKSKADSLFLIVSNKYALGLVRKQDVNEAEINVINFKDKIEQASLNLQQQYLSLQLLCETSDSLMVAQELRIDASLQDVQAIGNLNEENAKLQHAFSHAEYVAAQWANMPTLSLVTSFNYQNNSNTTFMDKKNPWINSNFWSLRLSWDFPTNVSKLTALKSSMISRNISEINANHAALQTKIQNDQAEQDYQKSLAQYQNNSIVYKLKNENYQKSKNQFEANILPFDKLLLAQSDLLISEINVATSMAAISFNKSKIDIINQLK
jgi:outer membrane protein TolC